MVLTSVNQLITLARTTPALAGAIPKLSKLTTMDLSTAPKKSCNCGSKMNFTTVDVNKQVAESLLSSLSMQDFQAIKSVLDLTELCYYKRDVSQNRLELICV